MTQIKNICMEAWTPTLCTCRFANTFGFSWGYRNWHEANHDMDKGSHSTE